MKWKSQTHSAFGNFSNLRKVHGITTLFLKLAEDYNLTGLQTITKKSFHMLISKRTTKHCGTICCSKISSLGELFLFLVQMLKSFELTLFFQHTDWPLEWTTNHHQALNIWSGDLAIWQSGNLAIWQSNSNLTAIWLQSGSNLAIWEWQSCMTATSTSMTMVMAMAIAMAMCHRDCCWNNISRQARRTQRQTTQPFARPRGSRFSKLKITNRNSTMGWVTQNGEQHPLIIFIPFGKIFGKEKITKTWPCEKTKIQQRIARKNTSTPH